MACASTADQPGPSPQSIGYSSTARSAVIAGSAALPRLPSASSATRRLTHSATCAAWAGDSARASSCVTIASRSTRAARDHRVGVMSRAPTGTAPAVAAVPIPFFIAP